MTSRLLLQTLALGGLLLLAAGVQASVTLFYGDADDLGWTLEQLGDCERNVPAAVREVIVAARQADVVPDTVDRVLEDLDVSHRSAGSRWLKRKLWLWLLPQSISPDEMLGLYVRTWPYAGGRGLCTASQDLLGRPLDQLTAAETRDLLAHELR